MNVSNITNNVLPVYETVNTKRRKLPLPLVKKAPTGSVISQFKSGEKLFLSYIDLKKITSFLGPYELEKMERVNTEWYDILHRYWSDLGKEIHAFSWRDTRNNPYEEKWNCLLKMALVDIVYKKAQANQDQQQIALSLWKKYNFFSDNFPRFKLLLFKNFESHLGEVSILDILAIQEDIESGAKNKKSSDFFFKALLSANKGSLAPPKLQQISKMIDRAIENGVTCASLLLYVAKPNLWPKEVFEDKAIAASKKGDDIALVELIKTYSLNELQALNAKAPTIAIVRQRLSILGSPFQIVEEVQDKPSPSLVNIEEEHRPAVSRIVEIQDEEIQDAEVPLKTLQLKNTSLLNQKHPNDLVVLGKMHIRLRQFHEANQVLNQALKGLILEKKPPTLSLVTSMLTAKIELKKHHEANLLIDKYFAPSLNKIPSLTLAQAGMVKYLLNDFSAARRFFNTAVSKASEPLPECIGEYMRRLEIHK